MSRLMNFFAGMENGGLSELTGNNPPDIIALRQAANEAAAKQAAQGNVARKFGEASMDDLAKDPVSAHPQGGGVVQSVSVGGGAAITYVIKEP